MKAYSAVVKIAFALYDYYPFGGLQEDCLATALAVRSLGHDVHLFTRSWTGEKPAGIEAHILGKQGWTNTRRNEHFFRSLEKALEEQRPDGLVAFNRVPGADIYFAADPCYAARTRDWPVLKKIQPRHQYYLNLEKRVLAPPQTPEILVLTRREIDRFREFYSIDASKFHVLPPGVARVDYQKDIAEQNRREVRAELGCPDGAVVALFIGSGFRIKGLDRALKGMAANQSLVPELEFWIIGKGDGNRYRDLIKRTDLPVRLLGGRADVARFYEAADFLLHPAYSESAGKVLLEALTHGLPVLTTDTCGYGFHIEKAGAGMSLKSPFRQSALNQVLGKFIEDGDARALWGQSALRYAQGDLYGCHEAAAGIIEEILGQKH